MLRRRVTVLKRLHYCFLRFLCSKAICVDNSGSDGMRLNVAKSQTEHTQACETVHLGWLTPACQINMTAVVTGRDLCNFRVCVIRLLLSAQFLLCQSSATSRN